MSNYNSELQKYKTLVNHFQYPLFLLRVGSNNQFYFEAANDKFKDFFNLGQRGLEEVTPLELFGPGFSRYIKRDLLRVQMYEKMLKCEWQYQLQEQSMAVNAVLNPIVENNQVPEIVGWIGKKTGGVGAHEYDSMTGVYNRSYFEEELEELSAAEHPISFIFCDINGLKLVNDVFGHEQGDQLIRQTAELLQSNCRIDDLAVRWGGDEFVLLLPETGYESARQVMERIQSNAQVMSSDLIKLSFTMGLGVKENYNQSLTEIFKQAEEKMYQKKVRQSKQVKEAIIEELILEYKQQFDLSETNIGEITAVALELGRRLDLSQQKLERLERLIPIYNLGQVVVAGNDSVFSCEDQLRSHSEIGYHIASAVNKYSPAAEEILYHHRDWCSQSNSSKISGAEIPILARILHVIDYYTQAVYLGEEDTSFQGTKELTSFLRQESGQKFDPQVIKKLIEVLH